MKIEFDEDDKNYIDRINKDLEIGADVPLFINQVGKTYYINFTCTDIAKANAFIMEFLRPSNNIMEKFGIRVNSLNYCEGDNKVYQLKEFLQNFLNQLDEIK